VCRASFGKFKEKHIQEDHPMTQSAAARAMSPAQLAYIADDKELGDLLWQIAALPPEARRIVRMMVQHLSGQSR
jgi:hypothetical protein